MKFLPGLAFGDRVPAKFLYPQVFRFLGFRFLPHGPSELLQPLQRLLPALAEANAESVSVRLIRWKAWL